MSKQPDFAELHNNLGNALRAAGNVQEAADSYQRALTLSPDLVQAHNNLGGILYLLDRAEEAVECHRRAIAINQNDAASLIGEAIALHKLKKYDESSAQYQRALTLCPDDPAALLGFGITLTASDRCDEAAVWLRRAIAVSPADGAARMALGTALVGLNRHAEAFQQYREAAALMPVSPELTHNEAIALLAMGAWPEGWRRLEARFAVTSFFPAQAFPEHFSFWHGEPGIEGKTILLQAEQGLGDTLQYVRYVPLVAERGARVVLRVQPRLGKLLADMPGADVVMTLYDNPPDVDLICPLMGTAAGVFKRRWSQFRPGVPYLRTPPEYLLLWQALLGHRTRPRIGIAWSGSQHIPVRSMPLRALAPLLQRPDMEFHSLQLEIPDSDRDFLSTQPTLIDHSEEQKDFADTAGLVAQMDIVVTIDTSVAHLAGALAKPVWIMLPFSADCRWLLDRDDTPWYPTARLFRQKRPKDWGAVVADVVKALDQPP